LDVLVLGGNLHLVDSFTCLNEKTWLANFELGCLHVLAEGAGLRAELLQKREYFFFYGFKSFVAG
jgi:hypothetical protein